MPIEIETKIKVEKLDIYVRRLQELTAIPEGKFSQKDQFYDRPDRKLLRNDCGLRLRQTFGDNINHAQLCYKGAREKGKFKQRPEFEFAISEPDAADQFLKALGYEPILIVEKQRQVWRLNQCEVCLDKVKELGSFVEIEGPNVKAIEFVAAQLDLQDGKHITSSYAQMLSQKQNIPHGDERTYDY